MNEKNAMILVIMLFFSPQVLLFFTKLAIPIAPLIHLEHGKSENRTLPSIFILWILFPR